MAREPGEQHKLSCHLFSAPEASCPVCHRAFPSATLVQHANLCMDLPANDDDIPSPPSSAPSSPSKQHFDEPQPYASSEPAQVPDQSNNALNDWSSMPATSASPPSPRPGPVREPQDVGTTPIIDWLHPLGLSKYAAGILRAGYRLLGDLRATTPTDTVLRDKCGIVAMGARRKLLSALSTLPVEPCTTTKTAESVPPSRDSSAKDHTCVKRKVWAIFEPGYRAASPPKRPRFSGRNDKRNAGEGRPRRHSPAQRVPGTSFTVDSFTASLSDPGCTMFFLTHFHSDHYKGLRKTTIPSGARVWCTSVTGRLVKSLLRVPDAFLRTLPIGRKVDVPDAGRGPGAGASVWAFDANHCPGAVVLLFYVWSTKRYVLHSGDCRFDPRVFDRHEKLAQVVRSGLLDYLHLDTTYCNPKYVFPAQDKVLEQVVEIAHRENRRTRGRCLFFFGTYSIGKEKVFLAVANALDLKIYAGKRKRGILDALDLGPRFTERIVNSAREARVHVVSMRELAAGLLSRYVTSNGLNRDFVGRGLAIVMRPTGWSFTGSGETPRGSSRAADQAIFYNIPYSEHSSFDELQAFVAWANPARVVPTVNARSKEAADELRATLGHVDRSLRSVG